MPTLKVSHIARDRFAIAIRDHVIAVDQPVSDGGENSAPTPTDLFVASLTACVGHYARRYLDRHGLPTAGLAVSAEWQMASNPARVGAVRIDLHIPDGVPAERHAALLAVASHCTIHNTLDRPPTVTIDAAQGDVELGQSA
jgi:uncharacterized OsmC-like protein